MSLNKNNIIIADIYKGNKKVDKIYKGNTLIYESKLPVGTIVFESSTPGTYDIEITRSQNYSITLVGGGGGGQNTHWGFYTVGSTGGSGALVEGTVKLSKGTYTVVLGDGGNGRYFDTYAQTAYADPGQDTTGFGNTATGGGPAGGYTEYSGPHAIQGVGNNAIVVSGFTGTKGKDASTVGFYEHGGGGAPQAKGQSGYIKIVAA